MHTHTKEAATTLATFVVLVGTVHAGIWFHLFGIPDITVMNWPFHYFWFVVGAWLSILVVFGVYHRTVDSIEAEKAELHDEHGSPAETRATGDAVSEAGGD